MPCLAATTPHPGILTSVQSHSAGKVPCHFINPRLSLFVQRGHRFYTTVFAPLCPRAPFPELPLYMSSFPSLLDVLLVYSSDVAAYQKSGYGERRTRNEDGSWFLPPSSSLGVGYTRKTQGSGFAERGLIRSWNRAQAAAPNDHSGCPFV